jgi:hypothetical protein
MYSRFEALQFDITAFLDKHPKGSERRKSNVPTNLGLVAVDRVSTKQAISVGTIGIPRVRGLGYKSVEGWRLATFIDNHAIGRQLWIPYDGPSQTDNRPEMIATDGYSLLDGWRSAMTDPIDVFAKPDELLEEANGYLMAIGARAIEAGYTVIPPIPAEVS